MIKIKEKQKIEGNRKIICFLLTFFILLFSVFFLSGCSKEKSEKEINEEMISEASEAFGTDLDDSDGFGDSENVTENEEKGPASSEAEQENTEPLSEVIIPGEELSLGFAGDISFAEDWDTTLFMDERENGVSDCFSENLLEDMRGFDIFMLNNEFTYSKRGTKSEKEYTFRADPERVKNLYELGVDIVLLANNHVNDYGKDAMCDTFDTLKDAGIPYVGAGRNLEEAKKPYYFTVNGRKIAYVAASMAEANEDVRWTVLAEDDAPGILGCYEGEEEDFLETVREAAENADYVIANIHWGYEYLEYFTAEQQSLAEKVIEAGADAIIGTHPHVLQGIEFLNGKPVVYSLGNFWFNTKDMYTGMAELRLKVPKNKEEEITLSSLRFIPCTQYSLFTNEPTDPEERAEIISYVESLSLGVLIDENGIVEEY